MKLFETLLITLLAGGASAQVPESQFLLSSSKITYHVNYVLKSVEGTSEQAKGKGQCDQNNCEFLIAVPVKTFNSGDTNRDSHMLEVTKAADHPMITVKFKVAKKDLVSNPLISPEINFAGKTHTYNQIKFALTKEGSQYKVTGKLPLVLSDFNIERPTLLTVPIEDATPLDIETQWKAL